MEAYRQTRGPDGRVRVRVPWRGAPLLAHSMYNKSTAFTREEVYPMLEPAGPPGP